MTNAINVPRELTIERDVFGAMHIKLGDFDFIQIQYQHPYTDNASTKTLAERIAAILSAPSPAGVDGLGVVAWLCEWMGDKCGGVYSGLSKTSLEGLRRSQGEDVLIVSDEPLCRLSDAQAIIDGLRGEVDKLMNTFVRVADHLHIDCEKAKSAPGKPSDVFIAAIDQQAQRICELEGLLRAESARVDFLDAYIVTADAPDTGKAAMLADSGTLRECIDAAMSAGKDSAS